MRIKREYGNGTVSVIFDYKKQTVETRLYWTKDRFSTYTESMEYYYNRRKHKE